MSALMRFIEHKRSLIEREIKGNTINGRKVDVLCGQLIAYDDLRNFLLTTDKNQIHSC